jgi:cardiolipin synthase
MAGATGMPLVDGNRVDIYNNGDEFYPSMLDAIESARLSITMEQYIFWNGEVGRRFAEAFAEKARQGIPVKLLLDALGQPHSAPTFSRLEAGGCQLAWFRPFIGTLIANGGITANLVRWPAFTGGSDCGSLARDC